MPTYQELIDAGELGNDMPSKPRRAATPDARAKNRRKHVARTMGSFGYTADDYEKMVREQQGVCGICRQLPPNGEYLCIDHDHHPQPGHKRLRGLLCHACNTAIGKLGDSPERCERAAEYLRYHLKKNAL